MRNGKLKYCPFCRGGFDIVCIDENDNMEEVEYLDDYPELKREHAYTYGVLHTVMKHPDCPIATVGRKLLGEVEYDTIEEVIDVFNRRAAV